MNIKPIAILCGCLLVSLSSLKADPASTNSSVMNADEYRDKVYACWLGKCIGGTLGAPFEGARGTHNVTFYTRVKEADGEYFIGWNGDNPKDIRSHIRVAPGKSIPNDDLDLQLVWLQAMEDKNVEYDTSTLGDYWLKYVRTYVAEYGIGKLNYALGIMPPLSGHYNNRMKDSNGAWIRSEIWACLAPANPKLAATFAWNDASFDHGCAEGTWAELFTASLESAAFVEKDREKLIQIALSAIPAKSRIPKIVTLVQEDRKAGKTWQQTREDVLVATKDLGFFNAPRNIGFVILAWYYGEEDFGKSLCMAVNCGDDTDCTAATLGSLLGILNGRKGIPEEWVKPIGEDIQTAFLKNFKAPANITVLTDRVVAAQKQVAEKYHSPMTIDAGKTAIVQADELLKVEKSFVEEMAGRSPYQVCRSTDQLTLACDYKAMPEIKNGESRTLKLTLRNKSDRATKVALAVKGVQDGYQVSGIPSGEVEIPARGQYEIPLVVSVSQANENVKLIVEASQSGTTLSMPIGLINMDVKQTFEYHKRSGWVIGHLNGDVINARLMPPKK